MKRAARPSSDRHTWTRIATKAPTMRNGSNGVAAARQWRPDHRATSTNAAPRSAFANTLTPQSRQARLGPSRVRETDWLELLAIAGQSGSIRVAVPRGPPRPIGQIG